MSESPGGVSYTFSLAETDSMVWVRLTDNADGDVSVAWGHPDPPWGYMGVQAWTGAGRVNFGQIGPDTRLADSARRFLRGAQTAWHAYASDVGRHCAGSSDAVDPDDAVFAVGPDDPAVDPGAVHSSPLTANRRAPVPMT